MPATLADFRNAQKRTSRGLIGINLDPTAVRYDLPAIGRGPRRATLHIDQFLDVFAAYNEAIWPAQILAYVLGVVAVAALFRPGRTSDRVIAGVLGLMWLWTGILYHGLFFSRINAAAFAFGALFVVQGLAIAYVGVVRDGLRFGIRFDIATVVGAVLILYAAVVYPLIGIATGHAWPAMPFFGVTPCPVTIFTFGLLLMTSSRFSYWLLVIPFVWSLIGGSAAILLDVPQDWLLACQRRDSSTPHRCQGSPRRELWRPPERIVSSQMKRAVPIAMSSAPATASRTRERRPTEVPW